MAMMMASSKILLAWGLNWNVAFMGRTFPSQILRFLDRLHDALDDTNGEWEKYLFKT
jgi:hypothetical protein